MAELKKYKLKDINWVCGITDSGKCRAYPIVVSEDKTQIIDLFSNKTVRLKRNDENAIIENYTFDFPFSVRVLNYYEAIEYFCSEIKYEKLPNDLKNLINSGVTYEKLDKFAENKEMSSEELYLYSKVISKDYNRGIKKLARTKLQFDPREQ